HLLGRGAVGVRAVGERPRDVALRHEADRTVRPAYQRGTDGLLDERGRDMAQRVVDVHVDDRAGDESLDAGPAVEIHDVSLSSRLRRSRQAGGPSWLRP